MLEYAHMETKKVITLCSSASHYKPMLEVATRLKKLGYKVKYPFTADVMRKSGIWEIEHYKTWFQNDADYERKAVLMHKHFEKVVRCDAILVTNYPKNDHEGYIGANVLMEMGLAFHLRKPIYLLSQPDKNSPFTEEIWGMKPIVLNGDLKAIKI